MPRWPGRSTEKRICGRNWWWSTTYQMTKRGYVAHIFEACNHINCNLTPTQVWHAQGLYPKPGYCGHRSRGKVCVFYEARAEWPIHHCLGPRYIIAISISYLIWMVCQVFSACDQLVFLFLEVTLLQLEKLYGRSKEAQSFIQDLIKGSLAQLVATIFHYTEIPH